VIVTYIVFQDLRSECSRKEYLGGSLVGANRLYLTNLIRVSSDHSLLVNGLRLDFTTKIDAHFIYLSPPKVTFNVDDHG